MDEETYDYVQEAAVHQGWDFCVCSSYSYNWLTTINDHENKQSPLIYPVAMKIGTKSIFHDGSDPDKNRIGKILRRYNTEELMFVPIYLTDKDFSADANMKWLRGFESQIMRKFQTLSLSKGGLNHPNNRLETNFSFDEQSGSLVDPRMFVRQFIDAGLCFR